MTQPQEVETPTEQQLTGLVLTALTVWLAAVLPAVMASVVFTGLPDPSQMWRFTDIWVNQVDRLMPVLARLARRGWHMGNGMLGTGVPFDPDSPELEEVLARTRNLLVRVPDEVYRQVVKSMAVGRDRGESNAQIAQRVSNILDINGSENWLNRARVIARTEINRFESAGILALGRTVARRSRDRILKRWVDEDDSRVRRAHARVDNQLRELGEPFEVGGSLLQHPVDPSGLPEDVINCRCDLELVRVSRGR